MSHRQKNKHDKWNWQGPRKVPRTARWQDASSEEQNHPPAPRPLAVRRLPAPPRAPPPSYLLEPLSDAGAGYVGYAQPLTTTGAPKPSSKPSVIRPSCQYYARETEEDRQQSKQEPVRPEAPGPWYGEDGRLVSRTWRCPSTGRTLRYVAGRVAPHSEPDCQDDEPVVFYLAGLGDAEFKDNPKMLRKRFNHIQRLSLQPFLFLVPFRPPGDWWCIKGDDVTYGYLGEFVPETIDLLADLVEDLAGSRKVVGLGFSAGAYCLTELLAAGRPTFSAMAFGGLHGHGQADLDGVPKARQDGVLAKYEAWLDRLGEHSGVTGGIFAMHSEDDGWSPKRYAKPALQVLGTRNLELGFPRVRFTALPSGKGHKYEDEANWSQDIFNDMFKAIGRGGKIKLRGSIALALKEGPAASRAELPRVASVRGASCRWIPEEEGSDVDLEQVENGAEDSGEDAEQDMWDASESSDEDELNSGLADDDSAELRANAEEDTGGDMEELQDANSAEFAEEDSDDALEDDWREVSRLDMDEFQVEVEDSFLDLPGDLPSWAARAGEIFKQNGFVVLLGAISERKAANVLADCRAAAQRIVQPSTPVGNRHGGARYSFGKASSTGSMLHLPSYARHLLDNRAVLTFLRALSKLQSESEDSNGRESGYRCVSAGGDFVLAGERRFQRLHSDLGWTSKAANVRLPVPLIGANFIIHDITAENGPMRMVPETQLAQGNWKGNPVEPAKWRAFRLFPLPVGSVIVRDVRTLHGGSPNFSESVRYLPSIEFASMDFLQTPRGRTYISHASMSRELFEKLRPATKRYVHPEIIADATVNPSFSAERKERKERKTWS